MHQCGQFLVFFIVKCETSFTLNSEDDSQVDQNINFCATLLLVLQRNQITLSCDICVLLGLPGILPGTAPSYPSCAGPAPGSGSPAWEGSQVSGARPSAVLTSMHGIL